MVSYNKRHRSAFLRCLLHVLKHTTQLSGVAFATPKGTREHRQNILSMLTGH